ncbi:MAG: PilZ domain-containing protein [Treponema sp.]|jgi:c-di-GMP-binding flagellar brake protein YcgR|nr:PilZ domain-containing protein [Treponema sp.]
MLITILVIIIAVSGVLVLVLSQSNKDKRKSWIQFFAKGKDAGFSFKEIELLRRLAVKSALDDPGSLFWSQAQLDSCIRNLVRSARLAGGGDQSTQDFLSKLYDYRKKIEMEKPKIKNGITDTRQIEEGQSLRVLVNGQGVFASKMVKNIAQYLTIARPNNPKLPTSFSWTGLKLSIYFWREDDAGYVFDTAVEDEVFSKGTPSLKVSHGENLFRTQKRRSIRIKTHKAAFLYILDSDEPSRDIEMNPGLKCFVEDLSDSGCAVLIGGQAAAGLRIKVQFILNNAPICISGTVRSMDWREEENLSQLHMEADPMTIETRNHILGEVFGMLPEEDEDLPFRVLAEEAAGGGEPEEESAEPGGETVSNTSAIAENAL